MLFNSFPFLFGFLPLALAGYFMLARWSPAAGLCWLTGVSLVFYGWWNPLFIPVLVASVAGNYAAGWLLEATRQRDTLQRCILLTAIAANVLALVWCKYLDWLTGLVNGTGLVEITAPLVLLPLGMSFFTFTQIGYLLDVHDGTAATRGVAGYATFITFFPHLIAGPILQDREIAPQLADPATRRFSAMNLSIGLGIFCVGLAKKTLLADPMAASVASGFADAATLPLFAAWHTALGYSLQLYFDFSGYSDMAIGLARMFNIRFPLNFDSPYKARSVIDYWQRWHMTLTRWLTRTIYTPLSLAVMRRRIAHRRPVNQAAQKTPGGFATMIALPVLVTFAIAGVWHGSGAQFLVFGLLHALFLMLNRAWRVIHPVQRPPARLAVIWRVLLTYVCVVVASVFFRADDVRQATMLLAGMAGLHGLGPGIPVPAAFGMWIAGTSWPGWTGSLLQPVDLHRMLQAARELAWMAALYGIVWGLPNTQQIFARARPALEAVEMRPGWLLWRPTLPWAFGIGGLGMLALLSMGGTAEFLYFKF